MNKIPQFVIRYANNKIDRITGSGENVNERIRTIDKAVRMLENGLITLDECMKVIVDA
jgi:hypothetical protein